MVETCDCDTGRGENSSRGKWKQTRAMAMLREEDSKCQYSCVFGRGFLIIFWSQNLGESQVFVLGENVCFVIFLM